MTEHAKLSASGAHRWMNCPASTRMEDGISDVTSEYAAEGIRAHELAEGVLNGKPELLHADSEMVNYVLDYVNYIKLLPGTEFIEKRVDFSPWAPDGFGTADVLKIHEQIKTTHVVDLKYGMGVEVSAIKNEQLMLYALGAYNDFEYLYDIEIFKLHIVQPRLGNVSSWEISVDDLLEWGEEVKIKARAALSTDAPFNPGEKQCKFCKAVAICPGIAKKNLDLAQQEFYDVDSRSLTYAVNTALPTQETLNPNQISKILEAEELFNTWFKGLKNFAYSTLEKGGSFPGFKLVQGVKNREWIEDDETVKKFLQRKGIKIGDIFPKIVSPNQVQNLLKSKPKVWAGLADEHVKRDLGGYKLAPESDQRTAIQFNVGSEFDVIE